MHLINRRTFLAASAFAGTAAAIASGTPSKIIDTHAHFYDPARPEGVPWPPKDDKVLYRRVLPQELEAIAKPLGVTGVMVVEASPLIADNDWVLNLAENNPFIMGMVGHLNPGAPDFGALLERYHRNPRFKGIRCGNLWNQDLGADRANDQFIEGLKLLAQSGLEMDTANPNPALVQAVLRVTEKVPNLRVVMDHFPIDVPNDRQSAQALETDLHELAQRPHVYLKVSGVLRRVNGRVPDELSYYKSALDELWQLFGEDRLLYGSNWPVSNLIAPYPLVLKIVREYFAGKGAEPTEKYFWRNAEKVYGL
jgi:L-fuconolactonase